MPDHTYASAIVGSSKKYERKPADFYPTPPDVTIALMEFLALPAGTTVLEPACGDGAMSKILERYLGSESVYSSDLRTDTGYGRGGVDFITDTDTPRVDWIISNPPFNRSADFIRKSLSLTANVAFLLKSQYWHAKSRLQLFETYPPAFILPLTWRPSFLESERGRSPLMDVIWVVWKKGSTTTQFRPITRPVETVEKNEIGTFSLTDISQDGILVNEKLTERRDSGGNGVDTVSAKIMVNRSAFDLNNLLTFEEDRPADCADLSELLA